MWHEAGAFALGAALNLASALALVAGIYYRSTRRREYVFSYLTFNVVIYCVMALLTRTELSIGVGFGLFAIFSVLRYRTEATTFREMTYLFAVIALPVVNAVLLPAGEHRLALACNGVILVVLFVLEQGWGFAFEASQSVRYERLDLIAPERRTELLADLRHRTGLPVSGVELGPIDLVTDVVELRVTYPEGREPRHRRAHRLPRPLSRPARTRP